MENFRTLKPAQKKQAIETALKSGKWASRSALANSDKAIHTFLSNQKTVEQIAWRDSLDSLIPKSEKPSKPAQKPSLPSLPSLPSSDPRKEAFKKQLKEYLYFVSIVAYKKAIDSGLVFEDKSSLIPEIAEKIEELESVSGVKF